MFVALVVAEGKVLRLRSRRDGDDGEREELERDGDWASVGEMAARSRSRFDGLKDGSMRKQKRGNANSVQCFWSNRMTDRRNAPGTSAKWQCPLTWTLQAAAAAAVDDDGDEADAMHSLQ